MLSEEVTTEDTDHTDVRPQPISPTLSRMQDGPERLEQSIPHRLRVVHVVRVVRVVRVFRGYSYPWFWEKAEQVGRRANRTRSVS